MTFQRTLTSTFVVFSSKPFTCRDLRGVQELELLVIHRSNRGYKMNEAIYQIDDFTAGGGSRICTFLQIT